VARERSNQPAERTGLRVTRERAEEVIDRHAEEGIDLIARADEVNLEEDTRTWNLTRRRWVELTAEGLGSIYTTAGPRNEFQSATRFTSVINAGEGEKMHWSLDGTERAVNKLVSLKERLEYIDAPADRPAPPPVTAPKPAAPTKDSHVFIVHGHDDGTKTEVALLLRTAGDHPVTILHDKANQGRTLIEKFEDHADEAAYAVVILTADDIGAPRPAQEEDLNIETLKFRGRQNVVFEMGFFFGALGRRRTAVLYEEGIELPSDINGLVYIPLDDGGVWRYLLVKELRAAKLSFSLDKL
jgi:predicted nucleotide-binding protein